MRTKATESGQTNRRLESWKEIAAYVGRDERTAKRWEKTRGLPVHRLPGARSGVFGFTTEIDNWQRQSSPFPDSAALLSQPASDEPSASLQADNLRESRPIVPADILLQEGAPEAVQSSRPEFSVSGVARYPYLNAQSGVLLLVLVLFGLVLFSHRADGVHDGNPVISAPGNHGAVHAYIPAKDVEDLYLNGRYFWNKRTPADLRTALKFFTRAIERDPAYASAYIGLADTHFLMVEYASVPPRDAYPPAISAAIRAIALAPSMPEAHRSLAFASFYWNWDRNLAEREFRRAIELDPRDATTHHWFANMLMTSFRYQDALSEIETARKLDPTRIAILADRAHILQALGNDDEALSALLQIEQAEPSFIPTHWYLANSYRSSGNDQAYLHELKQIAVYSRREADIELAEAAERGFAASGKTGMNNFLAHKQVSLYQRGLAPAFEVASALALAGKGKEALGYLNLAYLSRDTQFLTLNNKSTFTTLRENAEFKALAGRSDHPYDEHKEIAELDRGNIYHPR